MLFGNLQFFAMCGRSMELKPRQVYFPTQPKSKSAPLLRAQLNNEPASRLSKTVRSVENQENYKKKNKENQEHRRRRSSRGFAELDPFADSITYLWLRSSCYMRMASDTLCASSPKAKELCGENRLHNRANRVECQSSLSCFNESHGNSVPERTNGSSSLNQNFRERKVPGTKNRWDT
ncbi:uncharacterized protein LOC120266873 [Dioscorea cayenensis subsp. rotundata]|uniref:Uncharacterized protein LOC120266873 n=1 Tax=Dioscorea cayennensis subsp. rotundata TaxID=55577 RepID=A0AB40BVL6_DIOCR|nr:uncharacterized protein LOC120266873 [Dioscorea cayenensis subsp. rotundata]